MAQGFLAPHPDRTHRSHLRSVSPQISFLTDDGISRQTIAQGMPECSGCTCMLVCALFYTLHTRPRVQQAPGIPCTLSFEGQGWANLGLSLSRENACLCFVSGRESAVDFPVD